MRSSGVGHYIHTHNNGDGEVWMGDGKGWRGDNGWAGELIVCSLQAQPSWKRARAAPVPWLPSL